MELLYGRWGQETTEDRPEKNYRMVGMVLGEEEGG